jgi:hypothetical protein
VPIYLRLAPDWLGRLTDGEHLLGEDLRLWQDMAEHPGWAKALARDE